MPTKRVLISLDADLLERIDHAARGAGATRSGYLRQLAEADLSAAGGPTRATRAESTTPGVMAPHGRSRPPRTGG